MTARAITLDTPADDTRRGGLFLGFANAFRKELSEWLHGPKVFIIAAVSIALAVFTTMVTKITEATTEPGQVLDLPMDPTFNVLLGWSGEVTAMIVIIATMTLISVERDRGTLAWSLTNPVSATSILASKFVAAMIVLGVTAVILPITVSVGVATVVYGGLPDIAMVAPFTVLFLLLPMLFIALTLGLGTGIRSTAGIAGVAFAILFVPQLVGGLVPGITELSPVSIGKWARAIATGDLAPVSILVAWVVSMLVIVVGSKVVFDRQEF